jgi:hypothetical protein
MTLLFYSTGTQLIMIDEKSELEVVFGLEHVAKAPSVACDVPGGDGAAVAGGDPEGERVADEDGVGLPILSPVARHGHPPCVGCFDGGADHVGAADVDVEVVLQHFHQSCYRSSPLWFFCWRGLCPLGR